MRQSATTGIKWTHLANPDGPSRKLSFFDLSVGWHRFRDPVDVVVREVNRGTRLLSSEGEYLQDGGNGGRP